MVLVVVSPLPPAVVVTAPSPVVDGETVVAVVKVVAVASGPVVPVPSELPLSEQDAMTRKPARAAAMTRDLAMATLYRRR